jgi:hypothetical protein
MKYRIRPVDPCHDVWILQKRVLLVFWVTLEAGDKGRLENKRNQLNYPNPPSPGKKP